MNAPLVALVVENEPEHVETIRFHLEEHDVKSIVAGTLEEATAAFKTEGFDFVILDLGFPRRAGEVDEPKLGYEFLATLRSKRSREDLFVLVLTGASNKLEAAVSTLDLKGNAYVARHDLVEFRSKLATAVLEAQKWRKRRGDDDSRLIVRSWKDAKILLGNNKKVYAQTSTGKRREIRPPSNKLLETLARLAIADAAEGVEPPLGTGTRTRCTRLSNWIDEFAFRCEGGGRAFVTRTGRIVAILKVSQALDPAQRDDWEQGRRPQKPQRPRG